MDKTTMLVARGGGIPDELYELSKVEGVEVEKLRKLFAEGKIIITRNVRRRNLKIVGIGKGLSTKVNVNVGMSATVLNLEMEKEKAKIAVEYGADTIMDLSTAGKLSEVRRELMKASEALPLGTVPTYQAHIEGVQRFKSLPPEDFYLKVVEEHLMDGVDFMTIHAGITLELARKVVKSGRVEPIVSRGGAMLVAWMLENNAENPYYKNFDYLLELFAEYDATISLGDALRPGAIANALDELQVLELINNAKLVRRAREKGVQVMVEGPGHMPMDKIVADIKLMKSLTDEAPYYVLGPLVTDVASGYDHIAAAIGAAIAAAAGVDLICYLTPAEHLSLPNPEQVKEGLIAAKIAAHAGDIVKLGEKVSKWDLEMSRARAKLDWKKMFELSLDRKRAESIYRQFGVSVSSCNMCGPYCVFLIIAKYVEK